MFDNRNKSNSKKSFNQNQFDTHYFMAKFFGIQKTSSTPLILKQS